MMETQDCRLESGRAGDVAWIPLPCRAGSLCNVARRRRTSTAARLVVMANKVQNDAGQLLHFFHEHDIPVVYLGGQVHAREIDQGAPAEEGQAEAEEEPPIAPDTRQGARDEHDEPHGVQAKDDLLA